MKLQAGQPAWHVPSTAAQNRVVRDLSKLRQPPAFSEDKRCKLAA